MDQKQDPGEYHSLRLAGRWERLAAQFIDTFLVLIFIIPIMFLTGSMDQLIAGEQLGRLQMLQLVMGNYIIFFGLNGYLLFKQGQTIGKRLVKVQIVDQYGNGVPNQFVDFEIVPVGTNIGYINKEGATTAKDTTDNDGYTQVRWGLGTEVGSQNNRMRATAKVNQVHLVNSPYVFSASAMVGRAEQLVKVTNDSNLSSIIGLDNSNKDILQGDCPIVTSDGKYLFFRDDLNGSLRPFWMEAGFIRELRINELNDTD